MLAAISSMFASIFSNCASWLGSLMSSSGVFSLVLSMFVIYAVVKLLLSPIMAHRGSDQASKSKKKSEE